VRRRCRTGGLDAVRGHRGDHGAADPEALEPTALEHPAGAELVLRVLEHTSERALVRRLRRLAARVELGDRRADLVRRTRRELKLDAREHLSPTKPGPA